MSSTTNGAGYDARRRPEDADVRSRMLGVAENYIRRDGLTVTLNHIMFESIIEEAEVPANTAYRLWRRQEDFFADLLQQVASRRWKMSRFDEQEASAAIEAALAYGADLEDVRGRRRALLNGIRVAVQYEFEHLIVSTEWRTYVALSAAIMSLRNGRLKKMLLAKLERSEAEQTAKAATFYSQLCALAGFQVRPECGGDFSALATVIQSLVEGFALRSLGTPHLRSSLFEIEAFGLENAEWSMPALICVSAVDALLEVDDEYEFHPNLIQEAVGLLMDWSSGGNDH